MCGPWLLPVALMLGGSVAQYFGQKKADNAQWRAFSSERERQRALGEEQHGLFEDSLARGAEMADPNAQAAAAGRREESLVDVIAPAQGSYLPGSDSANPVVKTAADRAGVQGRQESEQLANALARLSGFGDQLLDTNIMNARNAGKIGQLGSFMAGSARAGEAEVEAAKNKGSTLRNVGGLAQMFGQAMLMGGGGSPFAAGAKATGAVGGSASNFAQLFGNPQGGMSWASAFGS